MSSFSSAQHGLTHIDDHGCPSMVDVSEKAISKRTASAQGRIFIPKMAFDLLNSQTMGSGIPPAQLTSQMDEDSIRQLEKAHSKGNVLTVAQLAGIMASKRTSELIPLCHPIPLTHVSVTLTLEETGDSAAAQDSHIPDTNLSQNYSVLCRATAVCTGKTGVEMEALTAVSTSLLTVWDMLKAVAGREMLITDVYVSSKEGGKSGDFSRPCS